MSVGTAQALQKLQMLYLDAASSAAPYPASRSHSISFWVASHFSTDLNLFPLLYLSHSRLATVH